MLLIVIDNFLLSNIVINLFFIDEGDVGKVGLLAVLIVVVIVGKCIIAVIKGVVIIILTDEHILAYFSIFPSWLILFLNHQTLLRLDLRLYLTHYPLPC